MTIRYYINSIEGFQHRYFEMENQEGHEPELDGRPQLLRTHFILTMPERNPPTEEGWIPPHAYGPKYGLRFLPVVDAVSFEMDVPVCPARYAADHNGRFTFTAVAEVYSRRVATTPASIYPEAMFDGMMQEEFARYINRYVLGDTKLAMFPVMGHEGALPGMGFQLRTTTGRVAYFKLYNRDEMKGDTASITSVAPGVMGIPFPRDGEQLQAGFYEGMSAGCTEELLSPEEWQFEGVPMQPGEGQMERLREEAHRRWVHLYWDFMARSDDRSTEEEGDAIYDAMYAEIGHDCSDHYKQLIRNMRLAANAEEN